MNTLRLLIPLLLSVMCLLAGGCATSRPKYNNHKSPDSAAIIGDTANVMRFFSEGESHVNLIEIDGLYLNPGMWGVGTVFVQPGKHMVTVATIGNNYATAQETVEASFEASRKYRFTALKTGFAFDLTLWDETDGTETRRELGKWRLRGTSNPAPAYVPIFIPSN